MLRQLWLRVRPAVLRRRIEREMQEEMAEHLRRSTERLTARGLSPEAARREALREFGDVGRVQEEARDARGTAWVDALVADVRFAWRHFARRPWTAATMLGVLAVGLAVTTIFFSYVHAYAVQPPLGVNPQAELFRIRGSQSAGADGRVGRSFTEEEFLAYQAHPAFEAVGGTSDAPVALDAGDDPARLGLGGRATFVTENYFSLLGVRPVLGPGLPRPAPAAPVAVIGHRMWEELFGRDPAIVGRTVKVNGVAVTVVGVAPERFSGATGYAALHLWIPLAVRPALVPGAPSGFRAFARLRPGVDAREASAAARVVAARAAAATEAVEPSTEVVPYLAANGDPMHDRDVWLLTAGLGLLGLLVLAVTCTNVSALLTGLATARRREIAVRLSLGAGRARLVRQLLTESAALSTLAGVMALGIVWAVLRTVARAAPWLPLDASVTWQAVAFTWGVALVTGVGFGLSPALHATRVPLQHALRDSSATLAGARGRLQRALVVAQIAFTQPLMVMVAALLLMLFTEFKPTPRSEFTGNVAVLSLRSGGPDEDARAAVERVLEGVRATPGVRGAVPEWRSAVGLDGYTVHPDDRVGGTPRGPLRLAAMPASPGYFAVLGIPLVAGRELAARDVPPTPDAEVPVVVGAGLARRMWPGADPIGRRLRAGSDTASTPRTLLVVGVAADPRADAQGAGDADRVYVAPTGGEVAGSLLVRTAAPAATLLPALRRVARERAPRMAVELRTLAQVESGQQRTFRTVAGGVSAVGGAALLLSAIGLYAVVAFAVGQRRSEIAVRIAVGARGSQVVRRFVAEGLRLSALGLAIGLPVSLLGLRALMSALEAPPIPLPPVIAIAALGVALVATAAAWIPARRAAAVDPAATLRTG
jgi:predicted permease